MILTEAVMAERDQAYLINQELEKEIERLKRLVLAHQLENARLREALNIANFNNLP